MNLWHEDGIRVRGDIFIGQGLVPDLLQPDGAKGLIAACGHIPGSGIDFSEYASRPLEHPVSVEFGGETVLVLSGLLSRHGRPRAK